MNQTFRQMCLEQGCTRKTVETIQTDMREAVMVSAAIDEFGQISNEVMGFSIIVRNHEYFDVMRSTFMLGCIEREDLFVSKHEDVDADRGVNLFKFENVCMFERKLEVGNIEFIKIFAVME